jgi:tetratricopeptide (TPR) repeat protein
VFLFVILKKLKMKKASLLFVFPVVLFATYLFAFGVKRSAVPGILKFTTPVMCGSDATAEADTAGNGKFIPRLPGWGHYSYSIAARNDSARFYFNQGLTMYYSYHMKEAFASFKEASRFDPSAAMAYWGQALSLGPYYNAGGPYVAPAGLPAVLKQMNAAVGNAPEKEKALIAVMNQRYPQTGTKASDNEAYAQGMKKLMLANPADADLKMLYIDAVMLIHPWDFWAPDFTAKPWTPELLTLCKSVLTTNPEHPAALHYYVHLTEASRNPEAALANAGALKKLFPGIGHMVHMASHVYQRNGLYFQGVDANEKAAKCIVVYADMAKNIKLTKINSHFYAVETLCAFNGAMYERGMESAQRCRNAVKPSAGETYAQYLYMMPVLTMVRLGKWHELLKDSVGPNPQWCYARILYHFARGLSFLYTGKQDSAAAQLTLLRSRLDDPVLKQRHTIFSVGLEGATIAENILDGAILLGRNKFDEGVAAFKKAIVVEDNMTYSEPAEWPLPARQFLGAYLLKTDYNPQAEQVYREDLERNPGNGWSMLGMYQSLKAQNLTEKLAYYKAGFTRSFSHADEVPTSSVVTN